MQFAYLCYWEITNSPNKEEAPGNTRGFLFYTSQLVNSSTTES